jgi:hypothetical protein
LGVIRVGADNPTRGQYSDWSPGFLRFRIAVIVAAFSFSPQPNRLRSAFCSLLLATTVSAVCLAGIQEEPLVVVQNGRYGFIDHKGNLIIQPQFIWADDFWRGLGTVYACGRYVSIDASGTFLPRRIAVKGHLVPERQGQKFGFVDSDGHFKINPVFDDALPFSGGFAAVKVDDKWGFVDAAGHQVIPPQFESAYYFREGVAVAVLASGQVLIDTAGKSIASGYHFEDSVTDGRVPAYREGKAGYLNPQGEIVIPFLYENARSFSGGLAAVQKDGKWGYLDRDGRVVIPFEFDDAGTFSSGLAPAKVGSKTGFIDKAGKFSFFLPFAQAPGFLTADEDGLFLAESDVSRFWTDDNRFGYVNTAGQVIWGPAEGSPDHPPLFGWSDEDNSRSCESIPEVTRKKIASFPRN